jgi:hypothetical protein
LTPVKISSKDKELEDGKIMVQVIFGSSKTTTLFHFLYKDILWVMLHARYIDALYLKWDH